jgi:S-DNA-T family DNA segregation ATPase FtsK/SpoIIIE
VTKTRRAPARKPAHRKKKGARKQAPGLRQSLATHLGRQADDVWGLILIVVGVLAALGIYADLTGPVGRLLRDGAASAFGWGRLLVPVALCGIGAVLVQGRARAAEPGRAAIGFGFLGLASTGLLHLARNGADDPREAGGWIGAAVAGPLTSLLATWGAGIVLATLLVIAVLILTKTSVRAAVDTVSRGITAGLRWMGSLSSSQPTPEEEAATERHPSTKAPRRKKGEPVVAEVVTDDPLAEPAVEVHVPTEPVPAGDQLAIDLGPAAEPGNWRLPPLQLLKRSKNAEIDKRTLEVRGRTLEEALAAHGVETRLVGYTPGPTVTRFELELGPGVKVARVTSLQKDIAYAMAAPDIRLLAPIPGRSAIGVEVPNVTRQLVSLGDILTSEEARRAVHPLEVGIGKDIAGRPVMESLAAMPHVLIAGATGAGKSSCINSLLTSILLRATPDQVRMILVDPKRVELGQYNGLPHLLTQVVVNPKKAANALAWAVHEMERRTDLLAEAGVRDITGYNAAFDRGDLTTDPATGKEYQRLAFILVVVDELNDLMMVAARDVEESICRIAQMGRAFGIHLVIATQRPSVDVITGVIKANVPSRLAFAVSSLADSRVILDQPGAEKLVGKGDMLLLTASSNVPRRIQGPWVSEEEVRKVVAHWRRQAQPDYVQGVEGGDDSVTGFGGSPSGSVGGGGAAGDDDDEAMLQAAMELIVRSQLGSTSMLQRKLRVGFARAGRIMDLLEQRGVVGPSEGSKARAVLMTVEELEARQQAGV